MVTPPQISHPPEPPKNQSLSPQCSLLPEKWPPDIRFPFSLDLGSGQPHSHRKLAFPQRAQSRMKEAKQREKWSSACTPLSCSFPPTKSAHKIHPEGIQGRLDDAVGIFEKMGLDFLSTVLTKTLGET